jgi:hypothetical protein
MYNTQESNVRPAQSIYIFLWISEKETAIISLYRVDFFGFYNPEGLCSLFGRNSVISIQFELRLNWWSWKTTRHFVRFSDQTMRLEDTITEEGCSAYIRAMSQKNLKKRDRLEDLNVDGRKWNLKEKWIQAAQDRYQWWTFVNTITNRWS